MRKVPFAKTILLLLLAGAVGCPSGYRQAAERDTAEAWRAFLATEEGDEAERARARARLDDLSFAEAREQDDLAGYKRYLAAFPGGRHRAEAGARIESLRFEQAAAAEGPWALEDFLIRHPSGRHAEQARRLLIERRRVAALDAATPAAYEAFLRRFPGAAGAADVERALADAAFQDAVAADTLAAYEGYLRRFPGGPHRIEAEVGARSLRVRAAVLSGQLRQARQIVRSTGSDEVRQRLTRALDEARLRRAASLLDRDALRELAGAGTPEVAKEAERILTALSARPGQGADLSRAADRLATPEPGLPPAVLEVLVDHPDARRRWVAARALGYTGDARRLPALMKALTDRNVLVRLEAAQALRRLAASLHPVVRDVAFTEVLVDLSQRAASAARRTVEGILLDAAGRSSAARHALEAAAAEPTEILARLRLAELSPDPSRQAILLTGVALQLRDDLRRRLPALAAAVEAERVDDALLRQARALERAFADVLTRIEGLGLPEARFPWLPEARTLHTEAQARLSDAEARARVLDPSWLAWDVDEAQEGRLEAAALKLEDVEVLASAREVPGVAQALTAAARSPHEDVGRAARRALRPDPDDQETP